MGFLLLQADLDGHPRNSICLHKDKVYFTFKKSSVLTRGGMLVWITHVASRCYASFPKESCQCIAILSYDINCNCNLGPFLGHRLSCWFSQNGDDIFVMYTKTWSGPTCYFSFSDQQSLDTTSELQDSPVARTEIGRHIICHHMIAILALLSKYISWFFPATFGKGQCLAVSFHSYFSCFWRIKGKSYPSIIFKKLS